MADSMPRSRTDPAEHLEDHSGYAASAPVKDVWSRSGSKYRIRAIVLLALNVLLFAGVGSFAYWMRGGVRFAPVHDGYWDGFAAALVSIGGSAQSGALRSLLDGPISVQDVPLLMPIILGLLLAALISIPILVSMLYRFWSSIPFIGVVAFLAVMPWLAISLLLSCVLASVRPFKTRLRFVSALLGLVPAAIYLIVSWHGTTDFVAGTIDPIDRIKFVAPLVLAIVAAAAVFAVVLAMARLVDYRPGAIAPLLAVMLGLPVALFEFNVGRDELYYRVLEAAAEWYFTDRPAEDDLERAVWDRWERRPGPRRSIAAVRELEETRWLFELMSDIGPYQETAMTSYQKELADWCDWFVKYFPDSRYAVNALFIKARALDTRIDAGEFRRTKWIHFYDDHPSRKSRPTWRMIAETRPDSTAGAVALLRLAQLDAREGLIERATDRLDTVLRRLALLSQPHPPSPDVSTTLTQVLKRDSPQESLAISHERVLLETHRLHDLLAANRDPLYGYEPIHGARQSVSGVSFGFLDLDRRSEGYLHDLENLLATYPNCQIEDNIDLEIAIATEQIERRTQRLERVLERFPDRDAVPEALYRLAVAYKAAGQPDDSAETFARLLHAFPDSIWSRQAGFYTAGRPLIAGSRDAHDSNDQSSGS